MHTTQPAYERSGEPKNAWDYAGYRELVRREFGRGRPVFGTSLRAVAARHDAEVRRRGLAEPLLLPQLERGATRRTVRPAPASPRPAAPAPRPRSFPVGDGRVATWVQA